MNKDSTPSTADKPPTAEEVLKFLEAEIKAGTFSVCRSSYLIIHHKNGTLFKKS